LTSEFERIKILEGKISHIIEYVHKLTVENEKLKNQVKELKSEKRKYQEKIGKTDKLDESLKRYQEERGIIKEKIDAIIGQIDQLGI
jgi:FtsZ-binding cell division protein ZapB